MTQTAARAWHVNRTSETNMVEEALRKEGFERADVYRYNPASIRVRVIDSRFEGMPRDQRDALVEAVLDKLPEETQRDIVTLFTFAPSELQQSPKTLREHMLNAEFEASSRFEEEASTAATEIPALQPAPQESPAGQPKKLRSKNGEAGRTTKSSTKKGRSGQPKKK